MTNQAGLEYGDCCKEKCIKSIIRYRKRDGMRMLFMYCVNKGCGWKRDYVNPVPPKGYAVCTR